jgi:hypothetical protein
MPVIAKLSRQLYEKLGDAVTTELVEWFNQVDIAYREELGRLNLTAMERTTDLVDRRFAEFDLKLERRFQEFEARIEQRSEARFLGLDVKHDRRFAEFETRLEQRLGAIEQRVGENDATLAGMAHQLRDQKIEMNRRFADLEARLDNRIEQVRGEMVSFKAELIKWMFLFWIGSVATTLAISQALR